MTKRELNKLYKEAMKQAQKELLAGAKYIIKLTKENNKLKEQLLK